MKKLEKMNKHLQYFKAEIQTDGQNVYLMNKNAEVFLLTYANDDMVLLSEKGVPIFALNIKNDDSIDIYYKVDSKDSSSYTVYSSGQNKISIEKSFKGKSNGTFLLDAEESAVIFTAIINELCSSIKLTLDEDGNLQYFYFCKEENFMLKESSISKNFKNDAYNIRETISLTNPFRDSQTECHWDFSENDCYEIMTYGEIQEFLVFMQNFIKLCFASLDEDLCLRFPAYLRLVEQIKVLPKIRKKEKKEEEV